MKYMLLIYHDEQSFDALSKADRQEVYADYRKLIADLTAAGKYLAGDELQATSKAQTVRVREGRQLITDGPFAETREQLGGFFLIDVADASEARQIAARIPSALTGSIEVRPAAVVAEAAG
jgi:hypothetical protein